MRSKEVEKLADEKRNKAKMAANILFNTPKGISSLLIEDFVDDIISASILEISAIQLKTHEKNIFDDHLTNTGNLKRKIKNDFNNKPLREKL